MNAKYAVHSIVIITIYDHLKALTQLYKTTENNVNAIMHKYMLKVIEFLLSTGKLIKLMYVIPVGKTNLKFRSQTNVKIQKTKEVKTNMLNHLLLLGFFQENYYIASAC